MKRFLLTVLLGGLCSCEHIEFVSGTDTPAPTETEAKNFTFTIKGDFTNPEFSTVPDESSSVTTRSNAYMTADGVELTDMWVIDYKGGTIVQQLHQYNTDDNWGAPTMSLTLGTHHILFLASRGIEPAYNEGIVTWAKPYDTFYCDYEVTVVKTSNGNRAVTLDRVATKVNLVIEDVVPVGTTSIVLEPSVWYNGWNMLTGVPVAAANYQQTLAIPASWGGKTERMASSWSLSAADEWVTDLHYTSYVGVEKNGEVLIEGAPLKANRATNYMGNFYSNVGESNVSLNAEWLTAYEGVY